ncbi:MAG: hypothetical protein HY815_32425 [Candidatus Riflebacteria bacterium]|nr:hypothetical protein [Candidatus Riflebacteria bacterium]
MALLLELAERTAWWWAFDGAVIVCEAPVRLERDDRGRLHSARAQAIEYADGWGLYSWHGLRVDEDAILRLETLTVERILGEKNQEVMRGLIERVGAEWLFARAQAVVIDEKECGTLCRLALNGHEPLVVLRVRCPSTGRTYFLRVPPWMRTVESARAWTFDVPESEFAPLVET